MASSDGRERYLVAQYGLPSSVYGAMEAGQDGKCAICRRSPRGGLRLVVDHDHVTGHVRGLLCNDCNLFLGKAEAYLAATNSGYRPPLWTPGQSSPSSAIADGTTADKPSAAMPPDPYRKLLLALQKAGTRGAKVADLSVAAGRQKSWVYTCLGGLQAEGVVERLQHSRWRLLAAASEATATEIASDRDPYEALLEALTAAGPTGARADDLALQINRSRAWVYSHLQELERAGRITRSTRMTGHWRLNLPAERPAAGTGWRPSDLVRALTESRERRSR